jgi:hypothetical protein
VSLAFGAQEIGRGLAWSSIVLVAPLIEGEIEIIHVRL